MKYKFKKLHLKPLSVVGVNESNLHPHLDQTINPQRIEILKQSELVVLLISDKYWENEGLSAEIDVTITHKKPTLLIFNENVSDSDRRKLCNQFDESHIIYEIVIMDKTKNWEIDLQVLMVKLRIRAGII